MPRTRLAIRLTVLLRGITRLCLCLHGARVLVGVIPLLRSAKTLLRSSVARLRGCLAVGLLRRSPVPAAKTWRLSTLSLGRRAVSARARAVRVGVVLPLRRRATERRLPLRRCTIRGWLAAEALRRTAISRGLTAVRRWLATEAGWLATIRRRLTPEGLRRTAEAWRLAAQAWGLPPE